MSENGINALPNPFEDKNYIGRVIDTSITDLHVKLETASMRVGDFATVDTQGVGVFTRLIATHKDQDGNIIAGFQMLSSLDMEAGRATNGITHYPSIGNKVFRSSPQLVSWIATGVGGNTNTMTLGHLTEHIDSQEGHDELVTVDVMPRAFFGRHCAVLGSSGGGKSWTLARICEEIIKMRGKAILIDPTGEFISLAVENTSCVRHVSLGIAPDDSEGVTDAREIPCHFPYKFLTENQLFTMLEPAYSVQSPKLRSALKSLKLIRLLKKNRTTWPGLEITPKGNLIKLSNDKEPFEEALVKFARRLSDPHCDFDIHNLSVQLEMECIYPSLKGFPEKWGGRHDNDFGQCIGLIHRIDTLIHAPEMLWLFTDESSEVASFPDILEEFLNNSDEHIMRLSMRHVPSAHYAREIATDAVGRYLYDDARKGKFLDKAGNPLIVMLDEAHEFLNRKIGSAENPTELKSFGLIAKETRKYGLTCVVCTQRPQDVPVDVISQVGTFVVHRIINDNDRAIISHACGTLNKSSLEFLSSLSEGEALVMSTDFTLPVPLKIKAPQNPPISDTPTYKNWGKETQIGEFQITPHPSALTTPPP